jgi:hypothetical protein
MARDHDLPMTPARPNQFDAMSRVTDKLTQSPTSCPAKSGISFEGCVKFNLTQ